MGTRRRGRGITNDLQLSGEWISVSLVFAAAMVATICSAAVSLFAGTSRYFGTTLIGLPLSPDCVRINDRAPPTETELMAAVVMMFS